MPAEAADEHHRNDLAVLSAGQATVVEEHLDIDSAQRIYRSTKFPIRDGEGRTYAIGGVSIDITEEVEMQERLAASELAYRRVCERSPVPRWFFDAETLEVFLTNAAADSCYGVGALVGRSVTDVVLPDDRERFRDAILAAPDWRITGQWLHRGRDGRLFEVELDSVPVPYEGRAAVLVVARDVQGCAGRTVAVAMRGGTVGRPKHHAVESAAAAQWSATRSRLRRRASSSGRRRWHQAARARPLSQPRSWSSPSPGRRRRG
jgi:PAS domain S-box-containing protein